MKGQHSSKWIEIKPGVFKQIEEGMVVSIKDLKDKLQSIEKAIEETYGEFKPVPDGAPDYVREAVELYNHMLYGPRLADLNLKKQEILRILKEIEG